MAPVPDVIRPRRVLLLTASLSRGGAEQQVVDLAVTLRSRGWAVAVVTMLGHADSAHQDHLAALEAAGVRIHSLEIARGRPTPAALLRYRRFIRAWRPDVIHSHMVHANLLARIGRFLAPRVPVVNTVHNVIEGREGTGGQRSSRLREIAYRLTDPLASATTAVSDAATNRYLRVGAAPRGRIITVPNGFDFSHDLAPPGARDKVRRELDVGENFLWFTAGRLVPEKGHDLLIQAFNGVHRLHPRARLAIAGDGHERAALDRLIDQLELRDSVKLLGLRRDVPAVLAAADAFVLSSYVEGLPIVLLEAAAQGLPIVTTDVGGCREVAPPELGAILTGTNIPEIEAGMLRVMEMTADERARVGQNLRTHIQSGFDLLAVVDRWERIYTSAIAGVRLGDAGAP